MSPKTILKTSDRCVRVRWSGALESDQPVERGNELITSLIGRHCDRSKVKESTTSYLTEYHAVVTFENRSLAQRAYTDASKLRDNKEHFDNSFDGLTILHAPQEHDIDVCAVHGLQGSAVDSFFGDSKLWLRDLLPLTVPFDKARVMTFGYNSQLLDSQATATMTDWADTLLRSVGEVRISEPDCNRPIIFVSHSMGGLVTRRAMERLHQFSDQGQEYPGIRLKNCGILFLSTPHMGTTTADYGEMFSQVMSSLTGLRKEAILRQLQSFNDATGQSLDAWRIMHNADIRPPYECLCESRKTRYGLRSEMLVTQAAASFMERKATQLPDTDHYQVCRYDNAYSQGYKDVVRCLNNIRFKLLHPDLVASRPPHDDRLPGQPYPTSLRYPLARDTRTYLGASLKHDYGYFRGRDDVLSALHEAVGVDNPMTNNSIVALSGIGGIGKTEVLLQFGFTARETYNIFQFQAVPGESFESCVYRLAAAVGSEALSPNIPLVDREKIWSSCGRDQRVEAFTRWLQTSPLDTCLVMFDDIDALEQSADFESLSAALRTWPYPAMLTTRDPDLVLPLAEHSRRNNKLLSINALTEADLEPVMRQFVSGTLEFSKTDLCAISRSMEGHPMAACRAVQFICQELVLEIGQDPISRFLASFDRQSHDYELRESFFYFQPRLGRSLMSCFETSITRLGGMEHVCSRLLQFCAYLAVPGLDFRLFFQHPRPWLVAIPDGEHLRTRTIFDLSKADFRQTLSKLISTSAVTREKDGRLVIHPLMIEFLMHRQQHAGRIHVLKQIVLLCQTSIELDEERHMFEQFFTNCQNIARRFRIDLNDISPPPTILAAIHKHAAPQKPTTTLGSRIQSLELRLKELQHQQTASASDDLSTEEKRNKAVNGARQLTFEFEQIWEILPAEIPPRAADALCDLCHNMADLAGRMNNPAYHEKLRRRIRRLEKSKVITGPD